MSCSVVLFLVSLLSGKAIVTHRAAYVLQKQEIQSKTETVFLKILSQTEIVALL